MAVFKAVSHGQSQSLSRAIAYVLKESKTGGMAVGFGCTPETALSDFRAAQQSWQKTGGTNFYHYMLAFPEGETTPWETLDIAQELVQRISPFTGHQMLLACHRDKAHLHAHILVNAVNEKTGKKLQFGPHDLAQAKAICNEITQSRGLSVPEKGKTADGHERETVVSNDQGTYRFLQEAERSQETENEAPVSSYVRAIGEAVVDALVTATSRDAFIAQLDAAGITTAWQENRKHVTFTDRARQAAGEAKCKIRLGTLGKYYNLPSIKEELEIEFARNAERAQARAAADAAIEAGRAAAGESKAARRESEAALRESGDAVHESTAARRARAAEPRATETNPELRGQTGPAGGSSELISAPAQTEEAQHDETNIFEFLARWAVDVAERIRAAIENLVDSIRRRADQRTDHAPGGRDRGTDDRTGRAGGRELEAAQRTADAVRDTVRDYRDTARSSPDGVQQATDRRSSMGRRTDWER